MIMNDDGILITYYSFWTRRTSITGGLAFLSIAFHN